MTITEMAVVMLILGIIVAATATLSIGFTRTNAENTSRQTQIDDARQAVERISATLRTAVKPSQLVSCTQCGTVDAFTQGADLSVQFYANFNNPGNSVGPSRVTYTVATSGAGAGVLVEKLQTPDFAQASSTGYSYCPAEAANATSGCKSHLTVRRVAAGVQTGAPIFKYYDQAGNLLDTSQGGLVSGDLEKVLSIEVVLTVQSTEVTKPLPTTYIQRITLPNAEAVLRQDPGATP
jgi:type II secretory pathway pseudopilin PulG